MDFVYITLSIAIFLGFFTASVVGFAAPLIALPIMLLVIDFKTAISLMAIFFFVFSVFQIPSCWKEVDKKVFKKSFILVVIGIITGVMLISYIDPYFLSKGLGVFILYFVATKIFNFGKNSAFSKHQRFMSFLGGVSGGLFGAGGMFLIAYIYDQVKKSSSIRATTISLLGIMNITRLPIMWYEDMISYDIFFSSIIIAPAFIIAIILGNKVQKRISAEIFKKILLVILLLSGLHLILF